MLFFWLIVISYIFGLLVIFIRIWKISISTSAGISVYAQKIIFSHFEIANFIYTEN